MSPFPSVLWFPVSLQLQAHQLTNTYYTCTYMHICNTLAFQNFRVASFRHDGVSLKNTSCVSQKCTVDWTTRKDPGPLNNSGVRDCHAVGGGKTGYKWNMKHWLRNDRGSGLLQPLDQPEIWPNEVWCIRTKPHTTNSEESPLPLTGAQPTNPTMCWPTKSHCRC